MATFEEATGRSIDKAFADFDKKNPKVYLFFSEQVTRAIRRNKDKISSKHILGYIRWEVSLSTESTDGFKINDAYTSRYARKYAAEHPEYEHLFNYRDLRDGKSKGKPKSPVTPYQLEKLHAMLNGAELWFTGDEYKLIVSKKVKGKKEHIRYKVESTAIYNLVKKKFLKESEKNASFSFQLLLTQKATNYLMLHSIPKFVNK